MNKQEAIKLVIAAAGHGAAIAKREAAIAKYEAAIAKYETEHGEIARIGRHEVSDIERAIELVKRFELEEEDK